MRHRPNEDVWSITPQFVAMEICEQFLQGYGTSGMLPNGCRPRRPGGLVTTGSKVWCRTGNAAGAGSFVQLPDYPANINPTHIATAHTTCIELLQNEYLE
jgi:hypothetical protein